MSREILSQRHVCYPGRSEQLSRQYPAESLTMAPLGLCFLLTDVLNGSIDGMDLFSPVLSYDKWSIIERQQLLIRALISILIKEAQETSARRKPAECPGPRFCGS